MRSLRLLGITNFYPPYAGGGYGEICADIMAGLAARGHDVTMLVARGESGCGVNVHAELDYVLAPWRHPRRGLRAAVNDARVVREALVDGVDAALVWHMRGLVKPPLRLLHEAGLPVVYLLHDRWVLYERAGGPFLLPWTTLDRLFARRVREAVGALTRRRLEVRAPPIAEKGLVRFVSRWLRDEYARLGWQARDEGVLPAGIDAGAIAALRREPTRTPPQRLLFAGRIHPSKGLDIAVRALAKSIDPTYLTVVGPIDDAAHLEHVQQLAEHLGVGVRVHWRGEVAREEVLELLASEDVLLYPSVGDEAYSLGLLEALAAGIVVVTSAVGGPREYLEHERNALLFEPLDASALAAHLDRLAREPGLAERLTRGARRTSERLSLRAVLDEVEEILAGVVPTGPS
jgi:glycogen(starch) synthase